MSRYALVAALAVVLSFAGCALRPRYAELVPPGTAGAQARFVLVEKGSGRPLAGVPVELGAGKDRLRLTTDAGGGFTLPVDAKLAADNPMLVVSLPAGVAGYDLKALDAPAAAPMAAPAEVRPEATPPETKPEATPPETKPEATPPEAPPEVKPEATPPSEEQPGADAGSEPVSM